MVLNPNEIKLYTPRVHLKPYVYPEILEYVDAIRQNYWVHDEYNWNEDVQDYFAGVTEEEKEVITRTILAISQIEVAVKTYWRDLGRQLPAPEFDMVGTTFAESEVRHMQGYSHLLDLLGLNRHFKDTVENVPAIKDRLDYFKRFDANSLSGDQSPDGVARGLLKLILFSTFIEYSSLFSQFFVAKSFHKHTNRFRGLSNLVDATSKEEELHGKFGFHIVNLFREELPALFTPRFDEALLDEVFRAVRAELKVIEWIFEWGDLEFITKEDTFAFFLHRVSAALEVMGYHDVIDVERMAKVDKSVFEWFNVELVSTKHYDFFNQRPTNYNRMGQSFDPESLF